MRTKSALKRLFVGVCAFVMSLATFVGLVSITKVDAAATENAFDGMTWKDASGMALTPTDETLAVAKSGAVYNTTAVGVYDEASKTYTVSVELAFNMTTYDSGHMQCFIAPSATVPVSGSIGATGSLDAAVRMYYQTEAHYNEPKILVRAFNQNGYRTATYISGVKHDASVSYVLTWTITETAINMSFNGTDLGTSAAFKKADGTAWTLADFTDNGTPKAYFGVYNGACSPLTIKDAGTVTAEDEETEQTVTFDATKSRTWNGTGYVYPDENGRINNSWYSEQNIAQNYDETTKTLKVSVEMSFVQTAYTDKQVVVWLSPMAITDWNAQVNGGLGTAGSQLLHLRMYYQSQSLYDGNSLLVRAGDYGNYKTTNYLPVKHDGSTTYIITWIITETSVTVQFDGVDLCASGSATPYAMMKNASTAWTLADFMDENNQPQAYFGEMNSGGFGNAYVHNVSHDASNKISFIGASVRFSEQSGLRFGADISAADYERLIAYYGEDNVKLGVLLYPTVGLTNTELTHDTENVENVVCEKIQTLEDGTRRMQAVLLEIPSVHYDKDITARLYVSLTVNGTESVFYGDTTSDSIADVATRLYDAGVSETAQDGFDYTVTVGGNTYYSMYEQNQVDLLITFKGVN